jgi:hypothetical protein
MTISRHPEPCADPRPFLAVRSTCDSSFRSTCLPMVSPTDPREELDPRSLDPAALFGARLPSVFETRTSLADFCNIQRRAGNQTRALDPRRDGGLDLLPFLTCHAVSLAGAMVTRRAALRPLTMTPVLVPPTCVGLPNRDATVSASPSSLRPMWSED